MECCYKSLQLFQLTAINDDKFQWSVVTDKLNAFL